MSRRVSLGLCLTTIYFALAWVGLGFCQGNGIASPLGRPFVFPQSDNNALARTTYGLEIMPFSSGMLPRVLPAIPNLQAGFTYSFGKRVRHGRGTLDYLIPIDLAPATTLFGEVHGEFQDFWKAPAGGVILPPSVGVPGLAEVPISSQRRYDFAFGGGVRRGMSAESILGVNAFFDTTKVQGRWYSAGGIGLEFLSRLPGDGLLDVNFNYYGNLFSGTAFANAFRHGVGNFDIEAGYSQPVFDHALDLRIKAVGYQFDVGRKVYGWRTGVDATTSDGMFRLTYEYTTDRINAAYHSISGSIQIGLQLENLMRGESPFVKPEPVFSSPRNLRRVFHEQVKRRWFQPTQIVQRRGTPATPEPPPPPPPPPPPVPRIILTGIDTVGAGIFTFATNINIGAATFDVLRRDVIPPPDGVLMSYRFRMSDGSTQQVSATVATTSDPDGIVVANLWAPSLVATVGPAPMNNSTEASTVATFSEAHAIYINGPASAKPATITITISVPSRPEIVPLVITCTAMNI